MSRRARSMRAPPSARAARCAAMRRRGAFPRHFHAVPRAALFDRAIGIAFIVPALRVWRCA
eukprot:7231839-Lingulodinium_polyedra.AAC.1